ncbi:MAG TPA: hypothetical protein VG501_10150 [Rhizomicrobium sp.]|nr:hypothetical protein [Rhizomicrobium sp.]
MRETEKTWPGRVERLIRALLLLAASILLSGLAWLLGLYRLADPLWVYGTVGGIIVLAVLASRLGTRLIVRRMRPPGAPVR